MASFDIQWRSSTRKDLRRLPRDEVPRILAEVARLTVEPLPHGSQKLSGAEHTYFASGIIGSFTSFVGQQALSRFSASDTAKTFTDDTR